MHLATDHSSDQRNSKRHSPHRQNHCRLRVLLPLPHRLPRRLRPRSAVHSDHLDHQQARPMEDPTATAQVPRRPPTTRTPGHPRLLHHHGRLLPPDPARVRHEAPSRWAEGSGDATTRSHRCVGCYDCGKGYHRDRLCPDQNDTGPSTSTRFHPPTHPPSFLPQPLLPHPPTPKENRTNNPPSFPKQQTAKPTSSSTRSPSSSP